MRLNVYGNRATNHQYWTFDTFQADDVVIDPGDIGVVGFTDANYMNAVGAVYANALSTDYNNEGMDAGQRNKVSASYNNQVVAS